jgi:hypothetical protein
MTASLRRSVAAIAVAALCGCSKRPPQVNALAVAGHGLDLPPAAEARPPTPARACGELPKLRNVRATVRTDNASVSFDPFGGARDYRIYPVGPDGKALPDPIYRCGGGRGGPAVPLDEPAHRNELGAFDVYVNHDVDGFQRTTAQATLGHVYVVPGEGRLPVYSLGDPGVRKDNACLPGRFDEGRVKTYTTSDAERRTLLAAGWRDLGIPFYVPRSGTRGNVTVFTAVNEHPDPNMGSRFYFVAKAEKTARGQLSPTPAFDILAAAGPDTEPLMRAYYRGGCGWSHDELAAGQGRFELITRQGNRPVTTLQWSGLTGPTTLAIEALDVPCPYQGFLSATPVPAWTSPEKIAHQAFLTIEQMRAADAKQEVFINGQQDGTRRPRAVACAQVQVTPGPAEAGLEFHDDFSTDPGPFEEVIIPGFKNKYYSSHRYNLSFISVDHPSLTFGTMLGEFWVAYADWAADTNGKMRLTPNLKATLAADRFLYATMEVDSVTSGRRYPQLIISDRPAPLTDGYHTNLEKGFAIVVETVGIEHWPGRLDIQFCDHRGWDVNFQCPHFATDWSVDLANMRKPQPPAPIVGELSGVDRRVRWDVYASTRRVYVLLDGQPMACAQLPASKAAAGPVTVTYADVLYHSGVDVPDPPYTFHHKHMRTETRRHFDELGFKSGVPAPPWNETLFPCTSTMLP